MPVVSSLATEDVVGDDVLAFQVRASPDVSVVVEDFGEGFLSSCTEVTRETNGLKVGVRGAIGGDESNSLLNRDSVYLHVGTSCLESKIPCR